MSICRRVLVVTPNPSVANPVVGWASSEGHQTLVCTDFAQAKPELDARPPDLLVTELKLGAYNGLHLALRAQSHGSGTPTIIIGEADAYSEAEARRLRARYLPQPIDGAAFAETARAALAVEATTTPLLAGPVVVARRAEVGLSGTVPMPVPDVA